MTSLPRQAAQIHEARDHPAEKDDEVRTNPHPVAVKKILCRKDRGRLIFSTVA
jgi:hypothetical protein